MKDQAILGLKGLAIIGVVLHHIANRRLQLQTVEWIWITGQFFAWCVLAFICASGYLHGLSDSRKSKTVLEFLYARFDRLLLPFIFLAVCYSTLWQIVQAFHLPNVGTHIPRDYFGKLKETLWPLDSQVAQQIYFFPLLFGISVTLFLVHKSFGSVGLMATTVVAAGIGVICFPDSFTGFTLGVFLWGICFYGAGYLMFHFREEREKIRWALLGFTFVLIAFSAYNGVLRCIPLWLLHEGSALRLDRVPWLDKLGDAAGTIYVYHTPFVVLPLVLAAACLHGAVAQYIGIILAAAIAIGLCWLLFESLKETSAKIILM